MARAVVGNLGEAISKLSDSFTDLPKINVPFTNIVNRAQVTDFAADGLPKWGVDRVMVQQIVESQTEQGPNGERVWKAVNDIHDQIRFVGNWANVTNSEGCFVFGNSANDYIEITFYGTGLNVFLVTALSRDFRVSVDGGAEGSNLAFNHSEILRNRNYGCNTLFPLVNGLTAGLHTVKIRVVTPNFPLFGFEVVNSSASIFLPSTITYAGSRRLSSIAGTMSYNSGFESGTLGTRGGHVLVYQKTDGTIAKAVTPTNTSAAYLASANHTNEEVARVYHWREFGAGRTDDFSGLTTTAANRAFTLDDGTTTLVCNQCAQSNDGLEALQITSNSIGFLTITFVGTGLDIKWVSNTGTNSNANAFEVFIDGSSVGNWDTVSTGSSIIKKICSGLPYGTHTVKIFRNVPNVWSVQIQQFIVYAPKKPTLPSGAVALADYFVMADFAANTTAGVETIATGVLRKTAFREFVYVNGTGGTADWQISSLSPATQIGGQELNTDRQNAYFEYTFWGTGLEMRFVSQSNRSANIQVSLQSISSGGVLQNLTTTNFSTLSSSVYGTGVAFNATTGILDQQDASTTNGAGVRFSGLPLALYKIRFLNNTASSYIVINALDVITPIHSPKEIGPFRLQNTSLIGSCSIGDLRNFSIQQIPIKKSLCQAQTFSTATNTNTSFVPTGQLSSTIYLVEEAYVQISYSGMIYADAVGTAGEVQIYVNGSSVGNLKNPAASTTTYQTNVSDSIVISLPKGSHKIDVYFKRVSGTTSSLYLGNLTVREI